MKTLKALSTLSLTTLLASTPAWADAGATNKVYSSGLLVALFIGICALVVLIQVAPALLTMWGMVKGAMKAKDGKLSQVQVHR